MTTMTGGYPDRGQTYLSASPDRTITSSMQAGIEGSLMEFSDVDPTVTSGARMKRSNMRTWCQLVRNVSAGVLLPKRVVSWKTDKIGQQVDGYTDATNEFAAGVVDEFLPSSGVAVNDLFWIAVRGPTLVLTSLVAAETQIAYGDLLGALTAVTSGATTAGRVRVNALTATSTGTTDGSLGNAVMNSFARAMSTMSGSTNANLLINCFFMK